MDRARDSVQKALSCLDRAGRRLKRPSPDQADEVLSLLRAATDHLHQALDLQPDPSWVQPIHGAE